MSKKERPAEASVPVSEFAEAMAKVLEAAKPPTKKTIFTRKQNTPWSPKDGKAKSKLKRKIYQHGLPVHEKFVTSAEIDLMNKIRPGKYLDGFVSVIRRRDKGLDIDYPVKTSAQRLRLTSEFGVRNYTDLLTLLVDEAANPKKSEFDDSAEG